MLPGINPCFVGELKYKIINVLDVPWQNISKYFILSNKFIEEALNNGGNILVHCYAGVSRSASFVIAYLMHKGMNIF